MPDKQYTTATQHDSPFIVEINDSGRFYDEQQLNTIESEITSKSTPQDVIIFTHGWHHNAKHDDENLASFKRFIQEIEKKNLTAGVDLNTGKGRIS